MDLTWLGWVFAIDMGLSVLVWLFRAANGGYVKSDGECFWTAVVTGLYLLGFFTIGFVQ